MCLNDLCVNDVGVIKCINCDGFIRRRLMDIGFLLIKPSQLIHLITPTSLTHKSFKHIKIPHIIN